MTQPDPDVNVAHPSRIDPVTAYRILELRSRVFVMEQACVCLDPDGRDLESGTKWYWLDGANGGPVAHLRVLREQQSDPAGPNAAVSIGRVVTAPEARCDGLARSLVTAALGDHEGCDITISAQVHLASWYERFGFEVQGEPFDDHGITHVTMTLDSDAQRHLGGFGPDLAGRPIPSQTAVVSGTGASGLGGLSPAADPAEGWKASP